MTRSSLSSFLTDVIAKARDKMKTIAAGDGGITVVEEGLDANGEFPEAENEPDEEDLDLLVGDEPSVTRDTDEVINADEIDNEANIDEGDSNDATLPYDLVAKTFMEVLLTNEIGGHKDFWNNPVPCSLCEEDDTVDISAKVKIVSPLVPGLLTSYRKKPSKTRRPF
jgi:hypothetical protein